MRHHAVLASLAACLACQMAETAEQAETRMAEESAAATTEIRQISEAFSRQMSAGHMDSVAMHYATDGAVLAPNMPPANGREAILAEFTQMKASGATFALALHTDTVQANGPMAVERGRYTMTVTFPNGLVIPDTGKYLAQWRRTGDGWRMVNDIWNSNVAVPLPGQ